jgi:hypothetical protein
VITQDLETVDSKNFLSHKRVLKDLGRSKISEYGQVGKKRKNFSKRLTLLELIYAYRPS